MPALMIGCSLFVFPSSFCNILSSDHSGKQTIHNPFHLGDLSIHVEKINVELVSLHFLNYDPFLS